MKEDAQERAEKYIQYVEETLTRSTGLKINPGIVDSSSIEKILKLAENYLSDAKYYHKEEKMVTSLASISYSEGLLDGLKLLNLISS